MPPYRGGPKFTPSGEPIVYKKGHMKKHVYVYDTNDRTPFDVFQINPEPHMVGDRVMLQTYDLVARIPKKQGGKSLYMLVPLSYWGFICAIKRDALVAPTANQGLSPVQTRVLSLLDGFQFQMALELKRHPRRLPGPGPLVAGYSLDAPWVVDENWLPSMLLEPFVRRATGWAYTQNGYLPFKHECKKAGVEQYTQAQLRE